MGVLLSCGAAREGGQNIAKWCNEDFNKLIEDAQATTDVEKRTGALQAGPGDLP